MKAKKSKEISKHKNSLDKIMSIYKGVIESKFNPSQLDIEEVEKALWAVDHKDLQVLSKNELVYTTNAISTICYIFPEDERNETLKPALERIWAYAAGIINNINMVQKQPTTQEKTITDEEVEVAKMYNALTQYSVALNQKLNEAQQISNNMQALFAKLSSSLK